MGAKKSWYREISLELSAVLAHFSSNARRAPVDLGPDPAPAPEEAVGAEAANGDGAAAVLVDDTSLL